MCLLFSSSLVSNAWRNDDNDHTSRLGDGPDEDWWNGHEDAADGSHVREDLGTTSCLAAQHPLEIYLDDNGTRFRKLYGA